jgi:hypothetical protein
MGSLRTLKSQKSPREKKCFGDGFSKKTNHCVFECPEYDACCEVSSQRVATHVRTVIKYGQP